MQWVTFAGSVPSGVKKKKKKKSKQKSRQAESVCLLLLFLICFFTSQFLNHQTVFLICNCLLRQDYKFHLITQWFQSLRAVCQRNVCSIQEAALLPTDSNWWMKPSTSVDAVGSIAVSLLSFLNIVWARKWDVWSGSHRSFDFLRERKAESD